MRVKCIHLSNHVPAKGAVWLDLGDVLGEELESTTSQISNHQDVNLPVLVL